MTKQDAYETFQMADDIWQIALEFEFGVNASDRRYTIEGRGVDGSKLRAAYDARMAAMRAYEAERDARVQA